MYRIAALCLLALAACSAPEPSSSNASYQLPDGDIYGEIMNTERPVMFSTVDATPSDYFNKTVLVEATTIAVCKKKGCWMQVEDDGKKAMVRWETGCGGKYAFPMDAVGKRVLIQGSFYPKTISPEDIEHLEEEAGGKLELEEEGYEFNASSVMILPAK